MESVDDVARICNRACHFDEGVEYHEKLVVEYYICIGSFPQKLCQRTILYFRHLNQRGHVDSIPMKETCRTLGSPIR